MAGQGGFFDLPAEVMTALGAVAGYALAGELTVNQMNVLGNFLMLTGQILETIAAQRTQLQSRGDDGQLDALRAAVRALEDRMEQR